MKVLVDTSVWADFFNGHPSAEAEALERLLRGDGEVAICGVVIAEVFQGLRDEPEDLRRRFGDLDLLRPREPETYFDAADLYRALRRRGITVRSTVDCLLVCLAAEHDVWILAKDRDLSHILGSDLTAVRALPLE